jgi:hypothetical protein
VRQWAILRREASGWTTVFEDDGNERRNPEGYVAQDYINDSKSEKWGYCLDVLDHRSDGVHGFTIDLAFLALPQGNEDGVPIEIGWNERVRRYQELDIYDDPKKFKAEIRNPPHVKY